MKYKVVYTCIPSPFYCPFRIQEFDESGCKNIHICYKKQPNKCLRHNQFPDWCPLEDYEE